MYKVTNLHHEPVTILLLDHSRLWNDRVHVNLKPGCSIEFADDALSKEVEGLAKKRRVKLEHLEHLEPTPEAQGTPGGAGAGVGVRLAGPSTVRASAGLVDSDTTDHT